MKIKFQSMMLACVALMGVFATSCTDDALVEASRNYGDQPFELTVSQSGSDSRLALEQDGLTTMWEPGDKLVLVDKTRTLAPIYLNCTLEEKAATATFMSESGVPAGDYYVIYNYNENLAYGHKGFQSVDDINSHDDLVLWAELNIAEGVSSATVELKHLYAKVRVELQNAPEDPAMMGFQIGMYSSKKGFPVFKQFTSTGLVDAEYGYNPNSMNYNSNYTYFPSSRKFHNIRFGNYYPTSSYVEPGEEGGEGSYTYDWSKAEGLSALVLPADLTGEDMFFYVMSGNTCYEFKKTGVNIKAGTSYKVVLDINDATVSSLGQSYDNDSGQTLYQLSSAANWRHAAYWNCCEDYGNLIYYGHAYEITQSIDFTDEYFFPISTTKLKGGGNTLSNINLDWSNEDNVGLIRHEWNARNANRELQNMQFSDLACQVSNLTLENVTFKGNNYVGALGGWNIDASNCSVIGTSVVQGNNYVGGFVGVNNFNMYSFGNMAEMSSSYIKLSDVRIGASCTVSGKNYIGGIVGGYASTDYSYSELSPSSSIMLMESAKSEATVAGSEDYVGGIFGKLGGNINAQSSSTNINFTMEDYTFSLIKCVNEGAVTGRHYVGGIGGDFAMTCNNYSSTLDRVVLSQSCSTGDVTGETKVGGILGSSMATPNICYSIGEIKATTSTVGGIVGDFSMGYQARIANCYSLATISAGDNEKTGGIVGNAGGGMMGVTIKNCYYAADPDTYSFGGIVGYSAGSTNVTNCLTTLNSLGTNLGDHSISTGADSDGDGYPDWDYNGDGVYDNNDLYINCPDDTTGSIAAVTSILENIEVINGDNAYSTNIWPIETYPWYCVKFASFQADTDAPGFDNDTI